MKVYKCLITGGDVFSDAYKIEEDADGVYYIIQGVYKDYAPNNIDEKAFGFNKSEETEDDEDEDDQKLTLPEFVHDARLEITQNIIKKADFKAQLKEYMKKLSKKVELSKERQQAIQKFAVMILTDFSKYRFYHTEGDQFDMDGLVIPYVQEGTDDKTGVKCKIYVLKDALFEE